MRGLEPAAVHPTVHIHDRKIHPFAEFDHTLFLQADTCELMSNKGGASWDQSPYTAGHFMDIARSEGIVDPQQRCWRLPLKSWLENKDTWVGIPDGGKSLSDGRLELLTLSQ